MKRFLGLTQEEITENEKMWKEENAENIKLPVDSATAMRGAGITPGGLAGEQAGQTAEAPEDMAVAAEAGTETAAAEPAPPPL
jgi:hypothetical protein